MNISLCITTYNRYELLLESFQHVLTNPRITEIIIVDDCSLSEYWKKIEQLPKLNDKIKVYRQAANRGMSRNKADAIAYASNEWVIILDSDNVIDDRYLIGLDNLPEPLDNKVIYSPSFAWPQFDFRKYEGKFITSGNAKFFMDDAMFRCFLNCCNYFLNKASYIANYKEDLSIKGADTIAFNYEWLKAGYSFYIIPNCTYFHRVHDGSGFMENATYNISHAQHFEKLISAL